MTRKETIQQLAEEFLSSPRTIETRLSQIINNQYVFEDSFLNKVRQCKRTEGKEVIYFLNAIQ